MRKKVPFVAVLAIMLAFVFLSIETATVLFSLSFLYMLSGPVISLFRWNRKRVRIAEQSKPEHTDEDKSDPPV